MLFKKNFFDFQSSDKFDRIIIRDMNQWESGKQLPHALNHKILSFHGTREGDTENR